jgi:hypothetical protein
LNNHSRKQIDNLIDRFVSFEYKHPEIAGATTGKPPEEIETDEQKQRRFARMRQQRVEQGFSPSDYSQEEQEYYCKKRMQKDPEQ